MKVFYNDIDPFACEWMRWLIKCGEIPNGVVDERSIVDIQPGELEEFDQCHFFCGIAGWPIALRRAGWRGRCWTGSCPCPPFSAAGKKKACPECQGESPIPCPRRTGVFICCECGHSWYADGRHLFPEFHRLIAECRPPVVFGEQVSGGDGLVWLAGVRARMESSGYAFGAADLPSACVGAPHIRQRIFFAGVRVEVADCGRRGSWSELARLLGREPSSAAGEHGGMANAAGSRLAGTGQTAGSNGDGAHPNTQRRFGLREPSSNRSNGRLAHTDGGLTGNRGVQPGGEHGQQPQDDAAGPWADSIFIPCGDDESQDRGVLNPSFSGWLMGFPWIWTYCGLLARRSLAPRKSRAASESSVATATPSSQTLPQDSLDSLDDGSPEETEDELEGCDD